MKISYKHRQVVYYCFENVFITKIKVQSKFNIDARFNSHSFFLFQNLHNINIFFYLACMYKFSSIYLAPCATVNNNKPAKNTLQSGHYALKVRVGMWDQWITRHWRSLKSQNLV